MSFRTIFIIPIVGTIVFAWLVLFAHGRGRQDTFGEEKRIRLTKNFLKGN